MADALCRDAEVIAGDEGQKLKDAVWVDIVEALRKDVPEVAGLVTR